MVAGTITIATAAPYVVCTAINAVFHNIQNIACIDNTKQYIVCKSIQSWPYMSAIIALIYGYSIGIGDGYGAGDDDMVWDIGDMKVW